MRSKIFTRTVGYWPLQESSGQALDYSGNENHATSMNVSSYGVSGPLGSSAMGFDGSNSGIDVGNVTGGLSSVTLSAWVNFSSLQTSEWVSIFDDNDGSKKGVRLYKGKSNDEFRFFVNGTWIISGFKPDSDEWYHVVGKYDGKTARIYVNGRRRGSVSKTGDVRNTSETYIVSEFDGDYVFDGKIAHVRVWDYPLPEASIKALYNASRGGFSESDNKTL